MNQHLLANLISHNSSYPTFCRADRDSKTASTLFLRRHSKGHGVTIVTDIEFRSYHLASCSFSASVNHVTYGNVTHLSCWQPSSRHPYKQPPGRVRIPLSISQPIDGGSSCKMPTGFLVARWQRHDHQLFNVRISRCY